MISEADKDLDMLSNLWNANILKIEKIEFDKFLITEMCDSYFQLVVSKDQLAQLGNQLQQIAITNTVPAIQYKDGKEPWRDDE